MWQLAEVSEEFVLVSPAQEREPGAHTWVLPGGALGCGPGLGRQQRSPVLPPVCSGLSPGLQPSCCCADVNVPLELCPTSGSSASALSLYLPLGFAPGLCLATEPCPDVSFPHAGQTFGSRQGSRSLEASRS